MERLTILRVFFCNQPTGLTSLNYALDGQEIPGPLKPIHNVILVKVKEAADVSAGGIVLPDQVCVYRDTVGLTTQNKPHKMRFSIVGIAVVATAMCHDQVIQPFQYSR